MKISQTFDIKQFIPYGQCNAISQKDLSNIIGLDKRTIRLAILNARLSGEPICSSCDQVGGGYYYPESSLEATTYFRQQQARINTAQAAIKPVFDLIEGVGESE